MSHALKGWVRLGNLRNGAVFVTRDGVAAVKTEYRYTDHNPQPMCVLLASGEYAHFANLDREWVLEADVKLPDALLVPVPNAVDNA